jgi:hypothetical protein
MSLCKVNFGAPSGPFVASPPHSGRDLTHRRRLSLEKAPVVAHVSAAGAANQTSLFES